MAKETEFVFVAVLEITGDEIESTGSFSKQGLPIEIRLRPQTEDSVSVQTAAGVFTLPCKFPRGSVPGILYVTYHEDHFFSLFINGALIDFCEVRGKADFPDSTKGAVNSAIKIHETFVDHSIPSFADRYRLHMDLSAKYQTAVTLYPVFQYYHPLITLPDENIRDPSEILHIGSRYYVYFTLTPRAVHDGFTGVIGVSSCLDTDDPSDARNWSEPVEIIGKGSLQTDFDGTGCYTPDCYYDGSNIFVFYNANNSTHPRGLPQWNEPEHIFVAKSSQPASNFVKTPIHTQLQSNRALGYDVATVPGGHEMSNNEKAYDVALINHGQCWIMDDGERRYYYKGGGAASPGENWRHGTVCLVRGLDENWLNGFRHSAAPLIYEDSHMEGILITRVEDQLFLQLQIFGRAIGEWVTYVSDAADGLNWQYLGGGHWPRRDDIYPLSIGVLSPTNPAWGIGQFRDQNGQMMLGYLRIL